jgi:RNA polymerase sigma factor (sigma-70 family)
MIVNEYLSWRRRLARTLPRAQIEPTSVVSDGTSEHAERDEMLQRLAKRPKRQRAAVVLRYYVGLSDEDIAASLDCAVGTVRSLISRALAALRIDLPTRSLAHLESR